MSHQNHYGDAGHQLVQCHLNSIKIINGFVNGDHEDIVAKIGKWVTFQVRASSTSRCFSSHNTYNRGQVAQQKRFTEYDVDAFAFVYLPDPYPYYIAKEAIEDSISFTKDSFTRRGRDDSFNELLRRWGLTPVYIGTKPLPILEAVA